VHHPRVEEVWFVLSGRGRLWRRSGPQQDAVITDLVGGRSLVLTRGTTFQFRCDGDEPLRVLGTTSPVWAGPQDADAADGPWEPTV
jgi:mannose-6-phosphate isomerase-like protein (cupin superfamily)